MKSFPKYLTYTIFPILLGISIFILNNIDSPASITRIDPEYLCLLNGANVSVLQFKNIGYTDLPGTPFLVLTGFFIRITHLFFGKTGLIEDVITHPDFYLQSASFLLLLLIISTLIWGGRKILKTTNSIVTTVALQSMYILAPINFNLQMRYSTDRIFPLLVFVFSVYIILYLYDKIKPTKFAIISGIIVGVGFITKFNLVVLGILPLFILPPYKSWFTYIGTFLLSAVLSFLPIVDKFQNVKDFFTKLIFYEGSYGSGTEGIFNSSYLISTFKKVPELNLSFTILIAFSFISIGFVLFTKTQKENRKRILFLFACIIALLLEILLASKHFKNYYLTPVLALSGVIFTLNWEILTQGIRKKQFTTPVALVLIGCLALPLYPKLIEHLQKAKEKQEARLETNHFFEIEIGTNNYLFLEPTWLSGFSSVNGVLFGFSYVANKNDFTKHYLKSYPKVLSYEGDNKPIKHFRTIDAQIDTIFTPKTPIYLFSSKGRKTIQLQTELKNQAEALNLTTQFDTIYTNHKNNDHFITASFIPSALNPELKTWSFSNNMEDHPESWKQNGITNDIAFSGSFSSEIKRGSKYSSVCEIDSITNFASEINNLSITCKYFQKNGKNSTRLVVEIFNTKNERLWYPVVCSDYFKQTEEWDNFAYQIYIPKKFRDAQKANIYFYNSTKNAVYIDDFKVELTLKP